MKGSGGHAPSQAGGRGSTIHTLRSVAHELAEDLMTTTAVERRGTGAVLAVRLDSLILTMLFCEQSPYGQWLGRRMSGKVLWR